MTLRAFLVLFLFFTSTLFARAPLKVGLVLDKGGKDDKSFNASAYEGAQKAKSQLGIQLKVIECATDSALTPSLLTLAQHGYDLIIGIGFVQKSPLEEVAELFPKIHFLLIDDKSSLPNVRSVLFQEHEGSFLVGLIAALTAKTPKIGFVGGMEIPLIQRFQLGYQSGAQHARPGTEIVTHYVGASSDAWRNPARAKELALLQFSKGVEIIFCAAGSSCLGVFDAAQEKNRLAIGVDSNQNWVRPGFVLTSMEKAVNEAVFTTIQQANQGIFSSGVNYMGLKDGGVRFSLDHHNRSVLSPPVEKKALEAKELIIRGALKVPDFYQISRTKKGSSP